jgi:hypothetical protein
MFRHPEETRAATSVAVVELPSEQGMERWICWPARNGLEMFTIIEKPDGEVVSCFRAGRWLTIRDGVRWRPE